MRINKQRIWGVSETSLDSRQFLIKQSRQSAFAKLHLHGFAEEMAVLSGDSSNIAILDELLVRMPAATPNEWYPLFKEQIQARWRRMRN